MIPELALFTALIVGCFREHAGFELFPYHVNDVLHLLAELVAEDHSIPSPWSAVPHEPFRDLHGEHFFETERLGAKLEVRGGTVPYS